MKLKQKIAKWLRITEEDIKANDYYHPKLYGESNCVAYKIDGLVSSYGQVVEWPSGEGFDISFEDGKGHEKRISLHTDELDILFACLNHFKYFGE